MKAKLNTGKILKHFRANNLPIAHMQHLSANHEVMPIFVNEKNGAKIQKNVRPLEGECFSEILPK
jgi:hypothetical protein